jgi:hypothetical protein
VKTAKSRGLRRRHLARASRREFPETASGRPSSLGPRHRGGGPPGVGPLSDGPPGVARPDPGGQRQAGHVVPAVALEDAVDRAAQRAVDADRVAELQRAVSGRLLQREDSGSVSAARATAWWCAPTSSSSARSCRPRGWLCSGRTEVSGVEDLRVTAGAAQALGVLWDHQLARHDAG